jgi:phenylacetate-CoA ligase
MGSSIGNFIKGRKAPIKNFLYKVIPFKYRYGKKYYEFLNFLNQSKSWSYDQSKSYQLEKIKELLKFSNENIPYYQNIFKVNGFDCNIKHLDDLKNIPILTKEDIINNFDSLINKNFDKKYYKMNSSGTTGKRLEILGTDNLFKIEAAFITNAFNDHGSRLYEDHSVWLRRYSPSVDDPIFLNDPELNRSYMSAFDLNDDTVFEYVKYINLTKTKTLVSYPSTLYYFSLLCGKHNLKLTHVKHMHGASEVCLPQWRSKIKEITGIDIKMHYGQVEKVSFAHQDSENDFYRENLLYGLNEYDENNTIIGTGFYNQVMPLIRYKTNDKIILNNDVKLEGCNPKTILDVEGRNGDMLITQVGSYVPAVNFYSFMSKINEVDMFQIIQKKEDKSLNFYIVPNKKYNNLTEKKLLQEMENRLGKIDIKIKKVKSIERDKNSNKLKTVSLI